MNNKPPTSSPAPKLRRAQFMLAVQALAEILDGQRPADQILQTLFRAHPECGGRDRRWISDLVYGVLRDAQRLLAVAGAEPAALVAARALDTGIAEAAQLRDWGVSGLDALQFETPLTQAQQCNVPPAVFEAWAGQYGEAEAAALAAALNTAAPVDLRVNPLRATRDEVMARLRSEGYSAQPTPFSPLGLRLGTRLPLQNLALYREGWVEPQDEGSQLIALLLAAAPGETVADFCAGAGGKTLALAAMMKNHGRLLACDVQASRLARLLPRLQRAGVSCVERLALSDEHDAALEPWRGTCDAVLVDAPCSASGTWRRNPELRLRPLDLASLQRLQASILASAAQLVRPGGRLVYATCSLFEAENEAVAATFIASHPQFEPVDAGGILQGQGANYAGPVLKLLPHRHHTDGFFAAAFRRKA